MNELAEFDKANESKIIAYDVHINEDRHMNDSSPNSSDSASAEFHIRWLLAFSIFVEFIKMSGSTSMGRQVKICCRGCASRLKCWAVGLYSCMNSIQVLLNSEFKKGLLNHPKPHILSLFPDGRNLSQDWVGYLLGCEIEGNNPLIY
ncbi:MAG: hypothetical protein LUQ22_06215 [Methanotrichaceae archaeon]|nr:hypothetical protein [Methanotrichaceae archaeon]